MVFLFPKNEAVTNCFNSLSQTISTDYEMTLKRPYSQDIATYDVRPLFKKLSQKSVFLTHIDTCMNISIFTKKL